MLRVSFLGEGKVNQPFMSVVVPCCVPLTHMFAKGTGSLLSASFTVPDTSCPYMTEPEKTIKTTMAARNNIQLFTLLLL